MSKRNSPAALLAALGLPAQRGSTAELALTHRSFAFEEAEPVAHNERLEFLGDAVLETIVTDLIYRTYPDLAEGQMARMRAAVVNARALAGVARWLDLGAHLRLGKGEESSGGRDKESLLADTLEAVIGAAYLDIGIGALTDILRPLLAERLAVAHRDGGHDAKGALQEVVARDDGRRPSYRTASSGPDHDKRFTAHVYVDDELLGSGAGRSKREAELNAAREALVGIGEARPDEEPARRRSKNGGERNARAS